jgi:UDP-N-acetyl-D-mannosaminuronic acid dehydrogenase
MLRVCVVGLGRVGLPTAALAAAAGHHVIGVDRDPHQLARVRGGGAGDEPGLAELLAAHPIEVGSRVVPADAYVVCVGRPADAGGEGPAGADVAAALAEVAQVAPPGALCVLEGTVPVGTTDALVAAWPGLRVVVAPERVLPGRALAEIRDNPRLVGGPPSAVGAAAALMSSWVRGPITQVDARTAELCKLVENASRDVAIAFANTVAALARRHGVDGAQLRALANQHPRVSLLAPGIGVGGPCLPVDPWLLVDPDAPEPLLVAARRVNDGVPALAAARVDRERGTIGVLGLGYKPDVGDTRRSPAVEVVRALAHRDVVAHDPHVGGPVEGITLVPLAEVLRRDVVVRLVAHRAFDGWETAAARSACTLDLSGGWS